MTSAVESQYYQRGKVLFELRRYAEAERQFAAALNGSADDEHAYRARALCLYYLERRAEGRVAAQAALQIDPAYWLNHYALAACLAGFTSAPDWPECAERALRATLRFAPTDADTWALLSYLRWNEHRWSEMLDAANQGLAHDPRHVTCWIYRAEAFLAMNDPVQAERSARSALEVNPESAGAFSMLGKIRLEQGQLRESEGYLLDALRIRPEDSGAHFGMKLRKSRLQRWLHINGREPSIFFLPPEVGKPNSIEDISLLIRELLTPGKPLFVRLLARLMRLWRWLPQTFRPRASDEVTSFACLFFNLSLSTSSLAILLCMLAISWPALTQKSRNIGALAITLGWMAALVFSAYSTMRLRSWLYRQLASLKWRQPSVLLKI